MLVAVNAMEGDNKLNTAARTLPAIDDCKVKSTARHDYLTTVARNRGNVRLKK